VVAAGLAAAQPAAAGGAGSFRVSFDPPLAHDVAQANPDSPKSAVTVTVQAVGPNRRPVRDAVIDLTMTAPKPSPLARSDVPRIEGRRLLHTRFGAPEGRYSFRYVFPIRGTYRLDLRAGPAPGSHARFAAFGSSRTFRLQERSGELLKLILVGSGLCLFGALSAGVLARSHHLVTAREHGSDTAAFEHPGSASGLAVALLILLVGGFLAFLVIDAAKDVRAANRVARYQGPGVGATRSAHSGPLLLRYHSSRSSRDGVGVQTLVQTHGSVVESGTGRPVRSAKIEINALDRETGRPAFATSAQAAGGRFEWDQTYWDAVDYDVRLAAVPGARGHAFAPAAASLALSVQPMSPPLATKLVALVYLLVPLLIGIGAGLLVARRRWGPPRPRARSRRMVAAPG
jgi:hypothetical protein